MMMRFTFIQICIVFILCFTVLNLQAQIYFSDDFESGLGNWTNTVGNTTNFSLSSAYFHSSANCLRNSSQVSSGVNIIEQSIPFDLSTASDALFSFYHIAQTEGTFDKCYVEISTNGGTSYVALPAVAYRGASADYNTRGYFHENSYPINPDWENNGIPDNATWWVKEVFSLAAYAGQSNVKIRFRYTTDISTEEFGWVIDDIKIFENCSPLVTITQNCKSDLTYDLSVQITDLKGNVSVAISDGTTTYFSAVGLGTYAITNLLGAKTISVSGIGNPTICVFEQIVAACDICTLASAPTDECNIAPLLDLSQPFFGSTNCSYTVSTGISNLQGISINNDSYMSFVAGDPNIEIQFTVQAATANCSNGVQFLLMDGNCGALTGINGTDINPSSTPNVGTTASWTLSGLNVGQTYYILADGYAGDLCNYSFQPVSGVVLTPPNDTCASAKTLICGGSTDTASVIFASNTDAPLACTGGGTNTNGLWYKMVGNGNDYTVSTDYPATNFDTQINVYSGTCGLTSCIGGNDNGGTGTTSSFTWSTTNGQDYLIYIDGNGTAQGQFEVGLTCVVVPTCTTPSISIAAVAAQCETYDVTNLVVTDANSVAGVTVTYHSLAPTSATDMTNQLSSTTITASQTIFVMSADGSCFDVASVAITISQPITFSANGTNVNCNGGSNGSATTTTLGGITPYTYLWSNGTTTTNTSALTAVTYTVTVTDNAGCKKNATVTINEPPSITITNTITNVNCNGGSTGAIALTASGGTTPYTYNWGNGLVAGINPTSLTAGNYNVTVSDNNFCTVTAGTFNITQTNALVIATTVTDASCGLANGAVTTSVTGGFTSSYTYLWSNTATTTNLSNLNASTLSVTVSSGGCTKATNVLVNNPSPAITVTVNNNLNCFGDTDGQASVMAVGGVTPYTYNWDNGNTTTSTTGLSGGIHFISVSDNNACLRIGSITITEPAAINITNTLTNVVCNGESNGAIALNVTGGTTPYIYTWSNGALSGTNPINLIVGTYTVTISDSNACTATNTTTITEPILLTLSTTVTNATCGVNNGSIQTTVNGGASTSYSYNWSTTATTNAVTGLSGGIISVTVTSGFCTVTATDTVSASSMSMALNTAQNISCNAATDGAITSTLTGGATPLTYLWSNAASTSNLSNLTTGNYSLTVTDNDGCITIDTVTLTEPAALILNTTITNATCGVNNGSVITAVSGGPSTAYAYVWSNTEITPSVTGLAGGVISVTVSSGVCRIVKNETLSSSSVNLALTNTQTIDCNGNNNGIIISTVTGGITPYSYTWSNSSTSANLNNLTAGAYVITVTDNGGCSSFDAVTLTEPALLATSITGTNILCNGNNSGVITTAANGGTLPYTYSWSNGSTTSSINTLTSGNYSVTILDVNGCKAVLTNTITEPQVLALTLTTTNSSCFGDSNGSVVSTITGGTTPYNYLWSNGSTTASLTGIANSTFTVTVNDANGCNSINFITITEPTDITINIIVTDASCGVANGQLAAISTGGPSTSYSYLWSNGNTLATLTGLNASVFTVTVTSSVCVKTTNAIVNNPSPAITVTVNNNLNCFGDTNGQAAVTAVGGVTPYTYNWDNGTATSSVMGVNGGQHFVSVSDNNNCMRIEAFTITEPSQLVITTSVTNVVCNSEANGAINVVITGGTTGYTYAWSNLATTQNLALLLANTYILTVTDANACNQSIAVSITENTTLSATGNTVAVSCNGLSDGSALVLASGGASGYTYLWNNANTTANISNLIANSYWVTVSDANGCIAQFNTTVTEPTVLIATISITDASCGQSNGSVNAIVSGGPSSTYIYTWNINEITKTITGLAAQSVTVTVTSNSCTQLATGTIQNLGFTTSVSVTNTPACFGDNTGVISTTISIGFSPYVYLWNNNATTAQLNNITAGNYSVTITDNTGCNAINSITITEPTVLQLNLISNPISCFGMSDGAITVLASGGVSPYTYLWNAATTTSTISNLAANSYIVTVTDANSCTINKATTITEPIAIQFTLAENNIVCFGETNGNATITASSTSYTYLWNNSATTSSIGGLVAGIYTTTVSNANNCTASQSITITEPTQLMVSVTSANPTCIGGGTDGSIFAAASGGTSAYSYLWNTGSTLAATSNLSAGNYSAFVTDANNCKQIANVTLMPVSVTNASITNPGVLCTDLNTFDLIVSETGGIWSGSIVNNASFGTIDISTEGIYTINYTLGNGICKSDDAVIITVKQTPNLSNTILTPENCLGASDGSIALKMNNAANSYTYIWDDNSSLSTLSNITSGDYGVTISNDECFINELVTLEASIEGCDEIFIPNIFAPERQTNNVLYVRGHDLSNVKFVIFDRWGEAVFKSNSIDQGWDGTYKGKFMNSDVYVYMLTAIQKGQVISIQGNVTLIR